MKFIVHTCMYIVCNISTFKDKITNLSKHLNIGKKKKASLVQVLKRREMLSEHNMLKTFRQKKYIYTVFKCYKLIILRSL